MRRRDFIRKSALAVAAASVARAGISCKSRTRQEPYSGKRNIIYIRPQIPSVSIPSYQGTHYVDRVPDTLDIAERARLALNVLTASTDPDADYEMYFYLRAFTNPPVMVHDFSDWCQPKFMESLPLLRLITGDDLNSHVDRAWMDVTLKSIGPDGLFYFPTQGRPWFHDDLSRWVPTIVDRDGPKPTAANTSFTQFSHPQPSGRLIGAITIYGLRDKNSIWKQTTETMIDRWAQLATDKGNYAYYPRVFFAPGASAAPSLEMPVGMWAEETGGRLIQGLVQYYRVSGYEPARTLAQKLAHYLRYEGQYYDPSDGRFLTEPDRPAGSPMPGSKSGTAAERLKYGGHFHAHAIGLLSLLEYASAAGDRELIEYVKKGFEWGKNHPKSSDLVGFFPEWLDPYYTSVETCEVADMIALGIKLSQAGAGDYWDNVDRWLRNQFFENQLTSADWIYRLAATQKKAEVTPNESQDRPAERNLGGFAGWAALNDWALPQSKHGNAIMHCCTGNATRAIYYAWQSILNYEGETLRVNLLLNRASTWADLYSYIPYQGRVDLKVKKPCRSTLLRVPEWVKARSGQVACTVNGRQRNFGWAGRYIKLGPLAPGDMVAMTFPIAERSVKATIGEVDYTLVVKGSTVVSVDPPGKNCPLYQRAQYRQDQVPWREVNRFLSDQQVFW